MKITGRETEGGKFQYRRVIVFSGIYACRVSRLFVSSSLHLPATSHQLDHLILIGCDDPGQTAGQQHANQL